VDTWIGGLTNATANNDAVGGAFLRHFFKNKFMWPPWLPRL